MGIVPTDQLAASTSPFADAAGVAFGGNRDKVIAAVALVSTFGASTAGSSSRAGADGGGRGRHVPGAVREGARRAADARVGFVVSSVLVTGLMLMTCTKGLVGSSSS